MSRKFRPDVKHIAGRAPMPRPAVSPKVLAGILAEQARPPAMPPSAKMPMGMNCGGKVKGMASGGQVRGTGAAIKGKGFGGSM